MVIKLDMSALYLIKMSNYLANCLIILIQLIALPCHSPRIQIKVCSFVLLYLIILRRAILQFKV